MSFFLLLSYMGCSPCKLLCSDMADLAESCGYEITTEMMQECRDQQSGKSLAERGDCRAVRPSLEEEWDCDEVAAYFDDSSPPSSDDSGE